MSSTIASIRGWEIHRREDGGFGVYDSHGLAAGPFGTREAAVNAALLLPRIDLPRQPTMQTASPSA